MHTIYDGYCIHYLSFTGSESFHPEDPISMLINFRFAYEVPLL